MSISRNAAANYVGRFYVIVVGIVILPFYMSYLGDEAYGLVGLFTLVQSWLQLLNMGLSPTLSREAARAKVITNGFQNFYRILISYELIFSVMVICICVVTTFSSNWLVHSWLNIETLSFKDAKVALILLFFSAAIRLQASLYRSGIMGLEHQVYMNKVDVLIASFRFIGGWVLVSLITSEIVHFFSYQLFIAVIEVLIIRKKLFELVPDEEKSTYGFYKRSILPTFPFALSVAYSTSIWILITQIDKAVLSSILTLSELGYYSLVALIVGGILQMSQPLSEALRPRLTALAERGQNSEFYSLYLLGTQLVSAVSLSSAIIIAMNSKALIFMWTGNESAAIWGEDVLFWFALGNGVLAVSSFQYYLQFAYGKLKLHVIGTSISALVQIPIIVFAALNYGAIGAAKAWFFVRLFFFLFWTPLVHSYFENILHQQWFIRGVLGIFLVILALSLSFKLCAVDLNNRVEYFWFIFIQSIFVLFLSLMVIKKVRNRIRTKFF